MLKKSLTEKTKNKIFLKKKIVHGINSRGILNLLPDFLYKINSKYKNFLIFQVGINDSWHYKSLKGTACVPKNEFMNNLNEIYKKSKVYGYKKVFFINYHKLKLNRKEGNGKNPNQNLTTYTKLISKFCKKKN